MYLFKYSGYSRLRLPWIEICFSLGLFVVLDRPAFAADEPFPIVSVLVEEAPGNARSPVSEAVQAHLSDLQVNLKVQPIQAFPKLLRDQVSLSHDVMRQQGARAIVWADLSIKNKLFIYVSEPSEGNTLVREITFEGRNQENNRLEVLGIAVRTTVLALLRGGRIGIDTLGQTYEEVDIPKVKAEPSPPQKRPKKIEPAENETAEDAVEPSSRRKPRVGIRVGYGLGIYNRDLKIFQYVRNEISISFKGSVSMYAAYRFQPTVEVTDPSLTMRINHHPFEFGAAWSKTFGIMGIGLSMLVVNDPVSWSIEVQKEGIVSRNDTFRWLVGVVPKIDVRFHLNANLEIFSSFYVDIYFNEQAATLDSDTEQEIVVNPLDTRPHLSLGIAFGGF